MSMLTKLNFPASTHSMPAMKRWAPIGLFFAFCTFVAILAGCSTLDARQREWIFQPSDRTWGGGLAAAEGMDDVWISFKAQSGGDPVRLHGLWLEADQPASVPGSLAAPGGRAAANALATPNTLALPNPLAAPVLLYLHGARYNVTGSAPRMRRMQELGFSVLAIDYRGFGKSTAGLPSEKSAYEDARAAWDWLAQKFPDRPRYIFGHSLGGSIAIDLAAGVTDEKGTIVEGTFTSIADVVGSSEWGWMPLSMLITQRFEAVGKVARVGSPLLVVHGDSDRLILPDLGKKLFEAAVEPKRFLLVKGGSHHNTNLIGQAQYRSALVELMNLRPFATVGAGEAADPAATGAVDRSPSFGSRTSGPAAAALVTAGASAAVVGTGALATPTEIK